MSRFDDLDEYVSIPRVTSLALAPDGSWLAAAVQSLGPDPAKYLTSIWRVDVGGAEPVRLTRSAQGESSPAFLPDGSLLFASRRPDPGAKAGEDGQGGDAKPALWLLPAGGGEARRIAAPPGGVAAVATARDARSFLASVPVFPGAGGLDEDAARRKARADAGVSAILHAGGMVRHWDHDLGPDCLRLFAGPAPAGAGPAGDAGAAATGYGDLRDLTPEPGRALDEQDFELSPDGTLAVTGWQVHEGTSGPRTEVAVIDAATGARRVLLADAGYHFGRPAISPDGSQVAAIRTERDTYERFGDTTLVLVPLAGGEPRDLLAGFDRRPAELAWAPDSGAVYFTADDHGRCPVFRVRLASGEVSRVTADDAAYASLCPAPDGRSLYALRSAIAEPPAPVRIDLAAPPERPAALASPAGAVEVPGRVEEVTAQAPDGTPLRGWLVLPGGAGEGAGEQATGAPLLLWVHGGPWSSWNAWSWRWNPWLMAARGYAVLLPDPALSTGYGREFIARGHDGWGGAPYADIMAITDAVLRRPDIDADRTAMMGGSFGGYMANWIAGHTGRFRAIVSHAGLWALDQVLGTTDDPYFWRAIFGHPVTEPRRYAANSPHLHADKIVTPMLIVHGDRDYRVPVGEALRMYAELTGAGKQARFLYFPDENHWILKPGNVRAWYQTVLAFLAEHVLGEQWQQPELT